MGKLTTTQVDALRKIKRRNWPAGEPRMDWIQKATARVLLRNGLVATRVGTEGHPFTWSSPIIDLTDAGLAALQDEEAQP